MHPNDGDGMANSVDPDQTAPLRLLLEEQSDQGLHCMPRPGSFGYLRNIFFPEVS